jgi:hypothetical protein
MRYYILKNHAMGIDLETNRTKYEYIIFDTHQRSLKKVKTTFDKATGLADMLQAQRLSPIEANRKGYFNFKETKNLDIPLPF